MTRRAPSGPGRGHGPRRLILRGAVAVVPLAALPGCAGAAADDLPPLPPGTTPFAESGAWETTHDQFAGHVRDTVEHRYGRIVLAGHLLPRHLTWDDVAARYDAPLTARGWRPDEGMSGAERRGRLRVWAGGWRRAWRGAVVIALLHRPDPDGIGLGHSFFVGASR